MTGVIVPTYRSGFYSPTRGGQAKYPSLWRGCVGAWSPNLGSNGLILREQSHSKNHGTLTNMDPATDWVTSDNAGALDFDGTNDYVTLAGTAGLNVGLLDFTWSVWVRPAVFAATYNMAVSTVQSYAYFGFTNAGQICLDTLGNVTFRAGTGTLNVWQHLTATRTSGNDKIYKNGVLMGTSGVNDATNLNSATWAIGRYETGALYYFNGMIDDVRVYNRALTLSEIQILSRRRGISYELNRRSPYKAAATTALVKSQLIHSTAIVRSSSY